MRRQDGLYSAVASQPVFWKKVPVHLGLSVVGSLASFSTAAFCAGSMFIPAIDGTISGDLFPLGDSDYGLHWTANAATLPSGLRAFSMEIQSPGAKARAEGTVTAAGDQGSWQIHEAEVDLERSFAAIAARTSGTVAKLTVAGKIGMKGAGSIAESAYTGKLQFDLAGGSIANPADKWALHDATGRLVFPHFPQWSSEPRQRLAFREFTIGNLSLQKGEIEYTVESTKRIRVHRAQIEALGGKISIDEFEIDLENAQADFLVRLVGAELNALQGYLPKVVAEAHGRVDGQVRVHWNSATGLQVNVGTVQLRPGENASLRLLAGRGFLSSHVPEHYNIAPAWMGRLGRRFAQIFPAHRTLELIEQGEEMLIVESIQADLNPPAVSSDTTAVVRLVARPTRTDTVKKVRLTLKISGPLADVVRFGLDGRLSFGQ